MLCSRSMFALALAGSVTGCLRAHHGYRYEDVQEERHEVSEPEAPALDEVEAPEVEVPEEREPCAAPIGTYEYSDKPDVESGPCDTPIVSGPVTSVETTQDHTFVNRKGQRCTIRATQLEENGCRRIDDYACEGGSSLHTVCEVNRDGSVFDCVASTDNGHFQCEIRYEGTRTSDERACTPMGGTYRASVTRVAGDDEAGCLASSELELTDDAFASLLRGTSECRWDQPVLADDACSLTRAATCPEGDRASLACDWNSDSTEARCQVVSGVCEYELTLVR